MQRKKKKKRKTGRAKWNICDSGSILEGGGGGKKGKERKKSILRASTVSVHSRRDKESRCFEPSFVEGELMKLGSGYSNNGRNGCSRVHPLAGNRVERAAQMAERNGRAVHGNSRAYVGNVSYGISED